MSGPVQNENLKPEQQAPTPGLETAAQHHVVDTQELGSEVKATAPDQQLVIDSGLKDIGVKAAGIDAIQESDQDNNVKLPEKTDSSTQATAQINSLSEVRNIPTKKASRWATVSNHLQSKITEHKTNPKPAGLMDKILNLFNTNKSTITQQPEVSTTQTTGVVEQIPQPIPTITHNADQPLTQNMEGEQRAA
jgi:hypothetical protein